MIARYRTLGYKGCVLVLVLAAMAALLVFTLRPAGAQAQCVEVGEDIECNYLEHDTDRVEDFNPEGVPAGAEIAWTLVPTDDYQAFKIDQGSGVLSFKSPPNYENPTNKVTYKVTVRLESDIPAGRKMKDQMVTVKVTNKEEDGTVTLNNLQPQVRELLTAGLSDPDGSESGETWQWYRSSNRGDRSPEQIAGATGETYTPKPEDADMYLKAFVEYTDGKGDALDDAEQWSMHPVRAETGEDNANPVFGEDTTPNEADTKTAIREIDENTPAGTNIGPPVAATDDDLDVLTYSLGDGLVDTPEDGDTVSDGSFSIDAATGQLMTKAALDREAFGDADDQLDTTPGIQLSVTVTVKDPLGNRADNRALDTIEVYITVNDVNEVPTVSGPALLIRHAENSVVAGSVDLGLDSDPTTSDTVDDTEFTAADPDHTTDFDAHAQITWELSGPDASKFMIGDDATVDAGATSEPLQFKSAPDFEKPGDAGKDNVYHITVVARDGNLATGSRDVTIRVTNVEEMGTVKLSHIQPEVETSLTASLTDPDLGITDLKWQWYWGEDTSVVANLIPGATSATYKPTAIGPGASPSATQLSVKATYHDKVTNQNSVPDVVSQTSTHPVRESESPNTPEAKFYKDGITPDNAVERISDNEATTYVRYIEENQDRGTQVQVYSDADPPVLTETGADVTAWDTDGGTDIPDDDDKLQYELGGASKDYFEIDQGTQTAVVIQSTKKLDYETKKSHTVTVTVRDPSGPTVDDTVTVNIIVVNVDEKPEITGPKFVEHAENLAAVMGNYTAKDPERTGIDWTVLGSDGGDATADVADLKVTKLGGPNTKLAFKSAPSYETPKGGTDAPGLADAGNVYTVQLRATVNDATETDGLGGAPIVADEWVARTVKIRVTDVAEAPKFADDAKTLHVYEHTKKPSDEPTGYSPSLHRDVGVPVTAKDGDGDIHLTYSLSGTDAKYFTIVPATGLIKTIKKLDYETKKSFSVVVTATDPTGLSDTINITIEVDDVAETPDIITDSLSVSGQASVSYAENGTAAVATYTAQGENAASARWTLEGLDRGDFTLSTSSGATTMLRFARTPNYEAPADANTNNVYEVTVKATVGTESATRAVTVTVTDVVEVGMVEGQGSISHEENGRTVETYTATGPGTVTWTLEGDDSADFRISSAGVLTFRTSPDFEAPADANTDNVYMVTVKATGGGETHSIAVTITVTDVEDETTGPQTLLERYDDDKSGDIDKSEAIAAINDYLFGEGADAITKDQAIAVINLYLFG